MHYALTLAALALVVFGRWALHPYIGDAAPISPLYAVVAFAVWLGGWRPALMAAVVGFGIADFMFLEPQGVLALHQPDSLVHFVTFVVTSGVIIAFGEGLRRTQKKSSGITAQARGNELLLRESEEKYRRLVGLLPVAVYSCEAPSGVITFYNEHAAKLWGRKPNLGDTDDRFCGSYKLWKPDGTLLPHDQTPMAVALREGREFRNQEVVIERPDGSRIRVLVNIDPICDADGNVIGAVNAFHDVTARHEADVALRQSEERYRAIVESQTEMVCRFKPDGEILFVNGAYARARNATPEQLIGTHFWTYIPAPEHEGVKSLLRQLSPDQPEVRIENQFNTNHSIRTTLWTNRALSFDESGRATEVQSTGIDITDRKRAEELSATLAAIVASSDDAIVSKSVDGIINSWNAGAERLFGYTAQEAIGQPVTMIIPPELHHQERTLLARLRAGHRIDHFETVRVAKDGRHLDISLTVSPIRDSSGRIVGASKVARDITERKRAQAALARHAEELEAAVRRTTAELTQAHERQRAAERMAALGTLAAGLGHDMSNLLLPMEVRLGALKSETLSSKAQEDLRSVAASIDYLRNLSRSLRDLARDVLVGQENEHTDMHQWWQRTQPLLRSALPRGVRLESNLGNDEEGRAQSQLLVAASPHQITQIVFNLVQNAGEAIAQSGRVHGLVTINASAADGHVQLVLSDNGPGMSEEVRRRCMEPFFSTKKKALGGGIGLSLVSSIIERLQGRIQSQSAPQRGTTFTITLPAARATPEIEVLDRTPMRTVAVSLSDPRLRALVEWTLRAHRVAAIDVRAQPEAAVTNLWIVNAEHKQAAYEFVQNEACYAVIIGGDNGSPAPDHPRVFSTGPDPSPIILREVLNQALAHAPTHANRKEVHPEWPVEMSPQS